MGGILDMGKIEMTDEYVRVGTTLYKIVFQPLINGTFAKRRVPWSMGTLRYDHGKDFIASVPKYDGFCTVPSHVDYKRNIGSFLNLYEPITHISILYRNYQFYFWSLKKETPVKVLS